MRSWLCILCVVLAGCSVQPSPALPTIPPGATISCGPVVDPAVCQDAVRVAITAQLNPPPIASATLRRARPDDDCMRLLRPCDTGSIIVTLQSGDTLQDVALQRTDAGWLRFDLIR